MTVFSYRFKTYVKWPKKQRNRRTVQQTCILVCGHKQGLFFSPTWSLFSFSSFRLLKKKPSSWGSSVCVNWNSTNHISLFLFLYSLSFVSSLGFAKFSLNHAQTTIPFCFSIPCFKTICTGLSSRSCQRDTVFAAGFCLLRSPSARL